MILVRLQERTADEWMDVFRANGNVAAEPFLTTAEALHHPDIVAGGDIVTIDDPVVGAVRTIGPIAELTATPAVHRSARAARRRAHRRPCWPSGGRVRGRRPRPPRRRRRRPAARRHHHRRVRHDHRRADWRRLMLADLGARVIKVEPIDGDPYRHLIAGGTPVAKTTAGKSSICLDLKQPRGPAHRPPS